MPRLAERRKYIAAIGEKAEYFTLELQENGKTNVCVLDRNIEVEIINGSVFFSMHPDAMNEELEIAEVDKFWSCL